LFEQAHGGTVFLDEIGEMATSIQVKLLRVLQEGEVRRMGEGEVRRIDVRVLSATNVDLAQRIKEGSFRVDLFYRINVVEARIPCLCERPEDISELADFFLKQHRDPAPVLTPEAVNALTVYPWPGNVRELQNEMERSMALYARPAVVTPEMFSERVVQSSTDISFDERVLYDAPLARAVSYLEENLLKKALIRSNWNKSQTARTLGMSRQGLLKKIKRYGITRDSFGLAMEKNSS
jgi:transcriptional regulator with PAS, ATPase and Fis domain